MQGKNQEESAARAGMSVRTARTWQAGALPSDSSSKREWRTRPDPFSEVWDAEVVPLLEADSDRKLHAKTLLKTLQLRHPSTFPKSTLRTLQRRVREWRALHGSPKEVVFPQKHPPGREAAFDFTHCEKLDVTIAGVPFDHLLFTLKASHGKWVYAELAFGETWEAMSQGLQNAMWAAGGVFAVWRHDNLSAATREMRRSRGRGLTKRYQDLLDHYGATSTRIRPGKAAENGVAERGNGLLKTALDQQLRVRGTRDFKDVETYIAFVDGIVAEHNAEHSASIAREQEVLQALPRSPLPTYSVFQVSVRTWSTIHIAGRTYSVPSRLIGHEVTVHQHANSLDVFFNDQEVLKLPRLRGSDTVHVDYRHIIWSLLRKSGAFARYKFREELFPSLSFRRAYDALVGWRGERADIEYVRILHLAASTMQGPVERELDKRLTDGKRFEYVDIKAAVAPEPVQTPTVNISEPDIKQYDRLLRGAS